jgi:hypothetical protein
VGVAAPSDDGVLGQVQNEVDLPGGDGAGDLTGGGVDDLQVEGDGAVHDAGGIDGVEAEVDVPGLGRCLPLLRRCGGVGVDIGRGVCGELAGVVGDP